MFCVFVFFSSRRRHTRLVSDWSSDVCSSDLRHTRRPSTQASARAPPPRTCRRACATPPGTCRSEERRVGKECRSGGAPYAETKKKRRRGAKRTQRSAQSRREQPTGDDSVETA